MSYCPKCNHEESKVYETLLLPDLGVRQRRRRCFNCDHRWATVETTRDEYKDLRALCTAMQQLAPLQAAGA